MGGGTETSGASGTNAGAMGYYDPNYNYGGYDYWGIAQTSSQFTPYIPQQGQSSQYLTPQTQNNQSDLLMVIQRLLGGY